jgi:hypothetical protein
MMAKKTNSLFIITEFFLFLLSIFASCNLHAQTDRYIWPIEIVGDISGNFGECRPDHFHAGLDIATSQKTGYKLYAIYAGYVYRVRTSAAGYGKALYLKLNDGRHVVYAHCERFVQPIERYVNQIQKKTGTYEVDTYVPENLFVFKQGDIVAFSGKSGDVAPHLHIELRNENEEPINILSHGLSLAKPDLTVPVLYHLAIKPVTYDSFTDNTLNQNIYPLTQRDDSTYIIHRPILAWGKIGLKINTIDFDNTRNYRLAPYVARFKINNKTIYEVKMDKFSYKTDYNDNFYLYDRELKYMVSSTVKGDYIRLFNMPGANLSFYGNNKTDGYLLCGDTKYAGSPNYLNTGDYPATIEVADQSGNTAVLKFTLRVEYPSILKKTIAVSDETIRIPLEINTQILMYDDFFSILLNTNRLPDRMPDVDIVNNAGTLHAKHILIRSDTMLEYVFAPEKDVAGVNTINITYNEDPSTQRKLTRAFPLTYIPALTTPSSVQYKVVDLRFPSTERAFIPFIETVEDTPEHKRVSLKKLSATYRIRPNGFELSSPATLQFTLTTKIPGVAALFEWIDNRWRLLYPIDIQSKNTVAANITHLSTYAVFSDDQPPRLEFVNPKQPNTRFVQGDKIVCKALDDGVGIAYKKIAMTIGSIKVPAEYDFDSSSISYTIDDELSKGKNDVSVTASDRLGNSKTVSTVIYIE